MKEREKIKPKTVIEILSEQLKAILTKNGITNLYIGEDGSLCGETRRITHYPTTHQLKNIRLTEINGELKIKADIVSSNENTGSVI